MMMARVGTMASQSSGRWYLPRCRHAAPAGSALLHLNPTQRSRRTMRTIASRVCCTHSSNLQAGECDDEINGRESVVERLLSRKWLMPQPYTKISRVRITSSDCNSQRENKLETLEHLRFTLEDEARGDSEVEHRIAGPMFYIIRDDLLHPLLGGNKLRKLDALLPELEELGTTDVVTCGGVQSAHTAALAFACAEREMSAHLLLRGEKPSIPTGYNLLSGMYGHNTFVSRSEYADRNSMLMKHATNIAGRSGSVFWLDEKEASVDHSGVSASNTQRVNAKLLWNELPDKGKEYWQSPRKVVVVKEGAGDAVALLGLIRLVHYLSQPSVFGSNNRLQIVVDSGTGTTAVGLALGIALLGLPWEVMGVMLADTLEGYEAHELRLLSEFYEKYLPSQSNNARLALSWRQRLHSRKFGNILPGDVQTCKSVAQQTGILLDPIYTLAGWEAAIQLSSRSLESHGAANAIVVMLHTGGTLGLFGLAQRFPAQFN